MTELVEENFDGSSGTLTHSTSWPPTGTASLKINGVGGSLPYKPGPWMHFMFDHDNHITFSTKEGKRGKPRTFFVQREGEARVELDEVEWTRQFDEARTLRR